jgi:hypothetical protein
VLKDSGVPLCTKDLKTTVELWSLQLSAGTITWTFKSFSHYHFLWNEHWTATVNTEVVICVVCIFLITETVVYFVRNLDFKRKGLLAQKYFSKHPISILVILLLAKLTYILKLQVLDTNDVLQLICILRTGILFQLWGCRSQEVNTFFWVWRIAQRMHSSSGCSAVLKHEESSSPISYFTVVSNATYLFSLHFFLNK